MSIPASASPLQVVGSTLALANQSAGAAEDHRAPGPDGWRHDLGRLVRAGFTAVDLVDGWLPFLALTPHELDDLRGVLDALGLACTGLSVSRISLVEPGLEAQNLERTLAALEVAVRLGVPVLEIGFHPRLDARTDGIWFWEVPARADERTEAVWSTAAAAVAQVCDAAARVGLAVSVELYEDSLVCTGADVVELIARVDRTNLGVNPDLGNTYRSATPQREPWLDTLRGAAPHMNYWHVKNYARSSARREGPFAVHPTALGDGDVDYRLALRTVLAAGYRGPVVVEHYGGDAMWMQEQGRAYLERLLTDWQEEHGDD